MALFASKLVQSTYFSNFQMQFVFSFFNFYYFTIMRRYLKTNRRLSLWFYYQIVLIRTHFNWRKRWDSNPRAREGQRISSAPRYDHFDTLPYFKIS